MIYQGNLRTVRKENSEILNLKSKIDTAPLSLLHKFLTEMEGQKSSTMIWWLVFIASTAGLFYAIYSHWEWLTLILPFVATSFVKALRIM